MYSPKSVVEAMQKRKFGTYWNQTETYEALKIYIQMNMDGLKDAVVQMLAGGSISFIPRKIYMDKPAVVIELKWDKSAEGAIQKIKDKQYIDALKDYYGNLLLAGIDYDKKTKQHSCIIEKWSL